MTRRSTLAAQIRATLAAHDEMAPEWNSFFPPRRLDEDFTDFFRRIPRHGLLLDSGCATGGRDIPMVMAHGLRYVGVDLSRRMLEVGRESLNERFRDRAKFVWADVHAMPFSEKSFDGFLAISLFLHILREDTGEVLREHWRVLKPGGVGIISLVRGSGTRMIRSKHTGKETLVISWRLEKFERVVRSAGLEVVHAKQYKSSVMFIVRRP